MAIYKTVNVTPKTKDMLDDLKVYHDTDIAKFMTRIITREHARMQQQINQCTCHELDKRPSDLHEDGCPNKVTI